MIIDFHTHIFPSFFRDDRHSHFKDEPGFELLYRSPGSKMAGKETLIDSMDKLGIKRSVIFGFPWRNKEHYRRNNDYIIESVIEYPDRLIGFCSFDPLSPGAPKEIERCLDAGLEGVGELAFYDSDFSADIIEALNDIMLLCVHRNKPILLHTNEPVGHNYPGKQPLTLYALYNLIKRYRSNRIVLAHWGGGLFFYNLMKKEVREVMTNVWLDTAASPYLYRPDIYRIAGEISGFDRIFFGSDFPLISPERYFTEMELAGISREALKGIKGINAASFLGLPIE